MQPTPSIATWRFLVDENLPRSLAPDLVSLGYDAEHVFDLGMSGAKDDSVYAFAQAQLKTTITSDKDFSNVLVYPPPHAGIIVVEIPDTLPPAARKKLILSQLATMVGQSFTDTLVIIAANRVRVRR